MAVAFSLDTDLRRELIASARWGRKRAVSTTGGLVVSSHPLASHIGAEILRAGGNAADAALARQGFAIHPFLFGMMFHQAEQLGSGAKGPAIFMPNGGLLHPGDILVQPEAADTLERLATEGSDFYYRGAFAEEFCEVVQGA